MNDNTLKISLVQSPLQWENIEANLQNFDDLLEELQEEETDLIVLPEMFTTGFTMNAPKVAEKMEGKTHQWLQNKAKKLQAAIMGSLVIAENGQYYNRLIWAFPDGTFQTYDKRHLFRMADEHKVYRGGEKRLIVKYKDWNICPLVCYDLRFPVWSRNASKEYDLLIYVANWPQMRAYAWSSLLQARAIENLAYVAGVNRVGIDGKKIPYSGDSTVIDFAGKIVWSCTKKPAIYTQTLSQTALQDYRKRFPAWMDADEYKIRL